MSNELVLNDRQISYTREFAITPFCFPTLPDRKDRFCLLILAEQPSLRLTNLLQYLLNSFCDEELIKGKDGLFQVREDLERVEEPAQRLRRKLALIDLSPTNKFASLHPNIVKGIDEASPKWLRNHSVLRVLHPNMLLNNGNPEGAWSKNYSHTIWITDSFETLPIPLLTLTHLTFLTSPRLILGYLQGHLGINNFQLPEGNSMMAISSTLRQDIQIMNLPPERFDCNYSKLTQ